MSSLSMLYYFRLKILALVIRTVVVLDRLYRRTVLRTTIDWERSMQQVSSVYSINSSAGRAIKVGSVCQSSGELLGR